MTISWPNLCIKIGVVPTALLAENYKNNPIAEYRMEALLYADRNLRGVEKG
jgi:hypothetical protein